MSDYSNHFNLTLTSPERRSRSRLTVDTYMGASTGILLLDIVFRPFLKFGMKFPIIGILFLMTVYGYIAYLVLKSTYLAESNY